MPTTRDVPVPPGYMLLTDAAAAAGVTRQSLLRAVQRTRAGRTHRARPPLPGRQLDLGWGTRNPWIVPAADAAAYAAAVAGDTDRPGRQPRQPISAR